MSGFENDEIRDWIKERFDEHTRLPRGPLELLPIPVDGHLTGASASAPRSGTPAWHVTVSCGESMDDVLRFYEEYLPLAGYAVTASGTFVERRSWLTRGKTPMAELIVISHGSHIGRIVIEPADAPSATRVQAEMAHRSHHSVNDLLDVDALRRCPEIHWRLAP